MPRSWKSQIADEVRATSMMKPKWPDDAMAHIASLQAYNDRLRQLLSEVEKREREAREKALEDLRELLQFTKWTAYVFHCPPPRSKRDNPLKHSSLVTLQGSHDSEEAALKAAKLAIGLGWVGSTIIHRETAQASAQFEIQKGVANSIARLAFGRAALERSEG